MPAVLPRSHYPVPSYRSNAKYSVPITAVIPAVHISVSLSRLTLMSAADAASIIIIIIIIKILILIKQWQYFFFLFATKDDVRPRSAAAAKSLSFPLTTSLPPRRLPLSDTRFSCHHFRTQTNTHTHTHTV